MFWCARLVPTRDFDRLRFGSGAMVLSQQFPKFGPTLIDVLLTRTSGVVQVDSTLGADSFATFSTNWRQGYSGQLVLTKRVIQIKYMLSIDALCVNVAALIVINPCSCHDVHYRQEDVVDIDMLPSGERN